MITVPSFNAPLQHGSDSGIGSVSLLADRARDAAASSASDTEDAFPTAGIAALHASGLLAAPLPTALGGDDLAVGDPVRLTAVLKAIGKGDLALGRLYEGHVNAVALAVRYGSPANLRCIKDEAEAGRISGVWMAGEPLHLERRVSGDMVLHGRKLLCSGCGTIRRPLVAAERGDGSVMLMPTVTEPDRVDLSGWTVRGMRGSMTGTVDFTGIVVAPDSIVGSPGDYLKSPFFRGGAWRVLAVQLGGVEAVLELYTEQLRASAHGDHPIQLARLGTALAAAETARLWVTRAGEVAEMGLFDMDETDAYVDLARNAFEAAALNVISCAEKAIGLKAFTRPNRLERVTRDLQTYLRQPALDASLIAAATHHLRRPA